MHASERYQEVRADHGAAMRDPQYRYRDESGQWRGGLVVSDPVGHRPGSLLFGLAQHLAPPAEQPTALVA